MCQKRIPVMSHKEEGYSRDLWRANKLQLLQPILLNKAPLNFSQSLFPAPVLFLHVMKVIDEFSMNK